VATQRHGFRNLPSEMQRQTHLGDRYRLFPISAAAAPNRSGLMDPGCADSRPRFQSGHPESLNEGGIRPGIQGHSRVRRMRTLDLAKPKVMAGAWR